jgi:DNA-binding CsgD family transcriptional regulator
MAQRLNDTAQLVHRLTDRELEVLRFMADDVTLERTAQWLGVSPDTIRTHRQNVYRKLRVHSSGAAVAEGFRAGVLR